MRARACMSVRMRACMHAHVRLCQFFPSGKTKDEYYWMVVVNVSRYEVKIFNLMEGGWGLEGSCYP